MHKFPSELLELSIGEIQKKRLVSKKYKDIIDSNKFWCQLFSIDYFNFYEIFSNEWDKKLNLLKKIFNEERNNL